MKKIIISTCILACFILLLIFIIPHKDTPSQESPLPKTSHFDAKNASYTVGGEVFTLKDGVASHDIAPMSSTKNTLRIFGEPVEGDLNGDGILDAALMLVNNPGGSGTFYYAVLAMSKNGSYVVTNTLLLGDRIAPQNIAIESGRAVYNYAERKASEPMTTPPSIGKSLYIHYDPVLGEIGEWVKDFEGESAQGAVEHTQKK